MITQEEDSVIDKLPVIDYVKLSPAHVSEETDGADPFLAPASEIKSLDGLTAVTKRRITNTLQKQYRGQEDTHSKKIELDEISGYNAFRAVQPPYNLDYLARLYEVSPAHYAAVGAKVANIVGLGYKLVETPKTKRRLESMEGDEAKQSKARRNLGRARDELTDLLETFNEEDTFTEILIKVWKDYETTGNGYIEIGRKRDGSIGYIGHCPSISVRIRQARDGYIQIISNKAVFFRNFGEGNLRREDYKDKPPTSDPIGGDENPNELIHFKKYSPTSTYYGIPDIIAAKNAVAGTEFAARYNLDYFENKAIPRHLILLKGARLSATSEARLIQFFETGLKGRNHRSLFIPLPGDTPDEKVEFKIEPVEANVQDSSFEKYNKANVSFVLMVHRVPITKVSVAEGIALAAARDADKTFKEQVCGPEQNIAEKKIDRIIREFTDAFQFSLNEMALTDADTQSKIDERDVKNQIKVPNEIRTDRGLPGRKGGDKPLELKPAQAADATANRQRDATRSANATDSAGESRNPKGDGRTTP